MAEAPFHILIADDEPNITKGLSVGLGMGEQNYQFFIAHDGLEAWKILQEEEIDLAILDLRMPKLSGEELLERIKQQFVGIPVIILTGHGSVENAVHAMRFGAYDFLTKPVHLEHLEMLVQRALQSRELKRQHRKLSQELNVLKSKKQLQLHSKNAEMQKVYDLVEQVASTKASVLITGESGVGKELIAEALHQLSERHDKELVKVHCAALTESLLESELFGHEKGAFTGARAQRKGRFELADHGSIFLDEIGEINSSLQIKLLRVLQEKSFERVGGEKTLEVDTRIIAATNRKLKDEVEAGRFREDLYYRLNVISIEIPPLRKRKEDIPLLVPLFLEKAKEENQRPHIEGFHPKALTLLYNYHWPGNIRELQNCIESAVVLARSKQIQVEDLPPVLQNQNDINNIIVPVGSSMAQIEEAAIRATIAYTKGNKSSAAKFLGIGRKTLHRKLHDYKMDDLLAKGPDEDD